MVASSSRSSPDSTASAIRSAYSSRWRGATANGAGASAGVATSAPNSSEPFTIRPAHGRSKRCTSPAVIASRTPSGSVSSSHMRRTVSSAPGTRCSSMSRTPCLRAASCSDSSIGASRSARNSGRMRRESRARPTPATKASGPAACSASSSQARSNGRAASRAASADVDDAGSPPPRKPSSSPTSSPATRDMARTAMARSRELRRPSRASDASESTYASRTAGGQRRVNDRPMGRSSAETPSPGAASQAASTSTRSRTRRPKTAGTAAIAGSASISSAAASRSAAARADAARLAVSVSADPAASRSSAHSSGSPPARRPSASANTSASLKRPTSAWPDMIGARRRHSSIAVGRGSARSASATSRLPLSAATRSSHSYPNPAKAGRPWSMPTRSRREARRSIAWFVVRERQGEPSTAPVRSPSAARCASRQWWAGTFARAARAATWTGSWSRASRSSALSIDATASGPSRPAQRIRCSYAVARSLADDRSAAATSSSRTSANGRYERRSSRSARSSAIARHERRLRTVLCRRGFGRCQTCPRAALPRRFSAQASSTALRRDGASLGISRFWASMTAGEARRKAAMVAVSRSARRRSTPRW